MSQHYMTDLFNNIEMQMHVIIDFKTDKLLWMCVCVDVYDWYSNRYTTVGNLLYVVQRIIYAWIKHGLSFVDNR